MKSYKIGFSGVGPLRLAKFGHPFSLPWIFFRILPHQMWEKGVENTKITPIFLYLPHKGYISKVNCKFWSMNMRKSRQYSINGWNFSISTVNLPPNPIPRTLTLFQFSLSRSHLGIENVFPLVGRILKTWDYPFQKRETLCIRMLFDTDFCQPKFVWRVYS